MSFRGARLCCAVLACLAVLVPATTAQAGSRSSVVLERINDARQSHGLHALKFAPRLAQSSRSHARRVLRTDRFGHGSNESRRFRVRGEVLGYQPGWRLRPRQLVRLWLRSSSHRALLLHPTFRYAGYGRSRGRLGSSRATIAVVRLGTP
ncbi:MAG: CAP domain-containing protein [Thermoleophilaceae bacterium]